MHGPDQFLQPGSHENSSPFLLLRPLQITLGTAIYKHESSEDCVCFAQLGLKEFPFSRGHMLPEISCYDRQL